MIYVYNEGNRMRSSGIITSVISIIFGLLISLLSAFAFEAMVEIVFSIIGIGIIASNLLPFIIAFKSMKYEKMYVLDFICSLISIVIGVLFIFEHTWIISLVCGIFLVIIPIVRIIASANKMLELKRQLPLFIVAILMFFNIASTILKIALIVIGAILAVLGVINLIMELVYSYKHRNDPPFDDNDPFNGNNPFDGMDEEGQAVNNKENVIDAEFKEL